LVFVSRDKRYNQTAIASLDIWTNQSIGYSLEEIADIFDGPRDHHIELSESEDKAPISHVGSTKTGVEFYEHNTKA